MYNHKITPAQSEYIKYRGRTGQIDRKATIINILKSEPGLIGARIADKMYSKVLYPISHGKVYEVLGDLVRDGILQKTSEGYYYLTGDAIAHDMAVTENIVKVLEKDGYSLDDLRFMSSAIIMAGENHIAASKGENYDISQTVASNIASAPEKSEEMSEDEVLNQNFDEANDLIADEVYPDVINPFEAEDFNAEVKEAIKREVNNKIQAEDEQLAKDKLNAERRKKLNEIQAPEDLIGKTVDINPGREGGQLIGTIIDMRSTGITFLITDSFDKSIEIGSVLPLEYSSGLTYKVAFDFDEL